MAADMTDEEYIADDDRLEVQYEPSVEYNITISRCYDGDNTYHYEAELAEWESSAGGVVLANASAKTAREAAIMVIEEVVYDFGD